ICPSTHFWSPAAPEGWFRGNYRLPILGYGHIKQRQPILQGLQSKAAKDESDAEGSEPPLRKAIRVVLDVRNHRRSDARNQAGHQPYPDRKSPGVVNVMHESTADKRRRDVADGSLDGCPQLTSCRTCSARCGIVHGGTHAAGI